MDTINQVNGKILNSLESTSNFNMAGIVLGLFLALYAALAAPNLPTSTTLIFKNNWFRLSCILLIAYMATKDTSLAIITAVAFLITLQTLSAQETTKTVISAVEEKVKVNIEKFSSESNDYNDIENFDSVPADYNENFESEFNDNNENIEDFASVPAKSSEYYDDDIEDYSLSRSKDLLYSGGGLHSSPDNVTREDESQQNFLAGSPAFVNDNRLIDADAQIFEQQVEGDTYYEVGLKNELVGYNNFDESKVQQVPFSTHSNNVHEDESPVHCQPVHSQPVHAQPVHSQPEHSQVVHSQPVHSQPVKAQQKKVKKSKNSKKKVVFSENQKGVEGFYNSTHYDLNFEDSDDEEDDDEETHMHVKEGFQNKEDFPSCGADPGEAVAGFDISEFASF